MTTGPSNLSPALQLVAHVLEHCPLKAKDPWRSAINGSLTLAIEAKLKFATGDHTVLVDQLRWGQWMYDDCEDLYRLAVGNRATPRNLSACKMLEAHLERPPFILRSIAHPGGERLRVGSQLDWDGQWPTVTSIASDRLIACTYKSDDEHEKDALVKALANNKFREPTYRRTVKRRITVTYSQLQEHNRRFKAEYEALCERSRQPST